VSGLTIHDIANLLQATGDADVEVEDDDNDPEYMDEDDDDENIYSLPKTSLEQPSEPQDAGVELLNSGDFGRVGVKAAVRHMDMNITKLLRSRVYQVQPSTYKEQYAHVSRFIIFINQISSPHFRVLSLIQMVPQWQPAMPTFILASFPLVRSLATQN
jgi:hypothetical protein